MSCTSVKSYTLSFLYFFSLTLGSLVFLSINANTALNGDCWCYPQIQRKHQVTPKKKKSARVMSKVTRNDADTRVLVGFPGIKALFREVRACWLDVREKASWQIKGDPWPSPMLSSIVISTGVHWSDCHSHTAVKTLPHHGSKKRKGGASKPGIFKPAKESAGISEWLNTKNGSIKDSL